MLEPIPFAGFVEIDESFDRTASHMAGEYVSNTKPVAWMNSKGDIILPAHQANKEYNIPLYAHPVKELTLTDDEVMDLWNQASSHPAEFARAILRKAQEK